MQRNPEPELIDDPSLPEAELSAAHRDLDRVNGWLGNTDVIIDRIRSDSLPVRRVLDVGCGWGGLLVQMRDRLGVEVMGVDLRPPARAAAPILCADAVRDPLPDADVAVSVAMAHHLDEAGVVGMIRNVGRHARRFIIVDLVRHPLPLLLFRAFIAPRLSPVAAADGRRSVRAAYTTGEMRNMVRQALEGSGTFHHSVAPFFIRQLLDIRYGP